MRGSRKSAKNRPRNSIQTSALTDPCPCELRDSRHVCVDRSWLLQREPRDGWAGTCAFTGPSGQKIALPRNHWRIGYRSKKFRLRPHMCQLTWVRGQGVRRAAHDNMGGTHHCSLWKRPLELTLALGGRLLLARRASISKKLVPVFGACSQAMRSCGRHAHGLHPSGQ